MRIIRWHNINVFSPVVASSGATASVDVDDIFRGFMELPRRTEVCNFLGGSYLDADRWFIPVRGSSEKEEVTSVLLERQKAIAEYLTRVRMLKTSC